MEPLPALRPGAAGVAQPRPVRALLRPRFGAALRAAPPGRLRAAAGRAARLPPARLDDAGPPGVRADPRRRDHHRAARPGAVQRGRHGDRPAAAGGTLQPRRLSPVRPSHLGARQRRRPDGGRRLGGLVAGRPPRARPADRLLRRQRDHDRRPDLAVVQRRRRQALRGLRLARPAGRGRQRPRGADGGGRGGAGRRGAAVAHRGAHPHRLWQPDQAGHRRRPRRAARRRGGGGHQAEPGLARGADLPRPPRGAPGPGRGRRPGRRGGRRLGGAGRQLPRRPRRGGGRARPAADAGAAGRLARDAARLRPRGRADRHPHGLGQGARDDRSGVARAGRRLRRPDRLGQHLPEGRGRLLGHRAGRQELLLRRARARHGRRAQRHGPVRAAAALRRHLSDLLRLHAAGDPAGGADGAAGDLRLHPRLDLPRRGRADPPAGEPAAVAARDPQPDRDPARRRQRDRGRLAGGPRTRRRADGAGADAPEAADPGRDRGARPRGRAARRLRAGRPGGGGAARHPDRHRLGAGAGARRPPAARRRGAADAGRQPAVVGAVRRPGAGLPQQRAAGQDRPAAGDRGRRAAGLGALRGTQGGGAGSRPIWRLGASRRAGRGVSADRRRGDPARAPAAGGLRDGQTRPTEVHRRHRPGAFRPRLLSRPAARRDRQRGGDADHRRRLPRRLPVPEGLWPARPGRDPARTGHRPDAAGAVLVGQRRDPARARPGLPVDLRHRQALPG